MHNYKVVGWKHVYSKKLQPCLTVVFMNAGVELQHLFY